MKRLAATLLLVSASLLLSGSAEARSIAKPAALNFKAMLIASGGVVTVPPEWDGLWTTSDSVYDCLDVLTETSTGEDTLCAGQIYSEVPEGSPIIPDCKGTATATTAHIDCTSSGTLGTCDYDFTSVLDVVRNGEFYRAVVTTSLTFTGGPECAFYPSTCNRIVTLGHRHASAPPAYCATPTKATTWGQVKIMYR